MGENLLDHRLLLDGADDTHLAGALGGSQGIDLPNFLMYSGNISCAIRFGLQLRISMI